MLEIKFPAVLSLRSLCVLCVSVVIVSIFTAETQRTQRLRREELIAVCRTESDAADASFFNSLDTEHARSVYDSIAGTQ